MNVPFGFHSCIRISSANDPAISMKSSPVTKYWIAITLWSIEKTYFRMNPSRRRMDVVVRPVLFDGSVRCDVHECSFCLTSG